MITRDQSHLSTVDNQRFLRSLWTDEDSGIEPMEVLGGGDEASWTSLASFRLKGRPFDEDARALQQRPEHEYGIFTVARYAMNSGACVRIMPQVFTSADEIGRLVDSLKRMRDAA